MLYELLVQPLAAPTSRPPSCGDLPEHIDDVVEIAPGESPKSGTLCRDMIVDIQRSFSNDGVAAPKGPDVKTLAAGVAIGVALLGVLGLYFTVREQPAKDVSAASQDNVIRRQVQAKHRVLTEAEIQKMVESHPEMQYIPEGPFVIGRLHQET